MAKSTKIQSRKKWTLGGIGLFLGIALVTTASATYIVGVNQTNQTPSVGVDVDTVQNNSIYFKMNVKEGSRLKLAEKQAVDSGLVQTGTGGDVTVDEDSMKVTFEVTVQYGEDYLTAGNHLEITYSLPHYKNGDITEIGDNADLLVSTDTINKRTKIDKTASSSAEVEEPDSWTYVDAPSKTTIPATTDTTWTIGAPSNGIITATANLTLEFQWGSYFNKKSPATFYNETFAENPTAVDAQNVTAELNAFHNELDGKTIALNATIASVANP